MKKIVNITSIFSSMVILAYTVLTCTVLTGQVQLNKGQINPVVVQVGATIKTNGADIGNSLKGLDGAVENIRTLRVPWLLLVFSRTINGVKNKGIALFEQQKRFIKALESMSKDEQCIAISKKIADLDAQDVEMDKISISWWEKSAAPFIEKLKTEIKKTIQEQKAFLQQIRSKIGCS